MGGYILGQIYLFLILLVSGLENAFPLLACPFVWFQDVVKNMFQVFPAPLAQNPHI